MEIQIKNYPISKPILFSTPMVQAIMTGKKSMTRRAIKMSLEHHLITDCNGSIEFFQGAWGCKECGAYHWDKSLKCKWQIGDVLWVRETFKYFLEEGKDEPIVIYKADYKNEEWSDWRMDDGANFKWKPSFFMPRKAARIFLEITDIKVERLQDISEEDAIAEGIGRWTEERLKSKPIHYQLYWVDNGDESLYSSDPIDSFRSLWVSINGKESWDSNPWVFALTFKQTNQ